MFLKILPFIFSQKELWEIVLKAYYKNTSLFLLLFLFSGITMKLPKHKGTIFL